MKRTLAPVCAIAAALSAACSGSSAAPTPPAPTVTSITVSGPDANVYLGATSQVSATSSTSNGTSATPACAWSSDTPTVASVNATGLVTGMGAGQANIICTSGGRSGGKPLRVLPNFG